jgi:hypothetical protein
VVAGHEVVSREEEMLARKEVVISKDDVLAWKEVVWEGVVLWEGVVPGEQVGLSWDERLQQENRNFVPWQAKDDLLWDEVTLRWEMMLSEGYRVCRVEVMLSQIQ